MQLQLSPNSFAFEIPGKAVAWQRVEVRNRATGAPVKYVAEETRSYQNLVKLAAREAMNGAEILVGPVALVVTLVIEIPASWSQRKQAEARAGERMPDGRPDLDNVVKSIKDGLNKVAYHDDAQVCVETHVKEYGTTPLCRVRVSALAAKGHK